MLNKKISSIAGVAVVGTFLAGTVLSINHVANRKFRPVFMNFQAYLDKDAMKELEEKFQYQEFSELNEFSRAIESKRIIGGIASDFEVARLIIGKQLKKVKYEKILQQVKNINDPDNFTANGMLKKSIVEKYLRPETVKHMDSYNKYLVDKDQKAIDIDKDGIPDEMWEFMLPYYIQDKVIAYTTGTYSNDKKTEIELRSNRLTDEEKENGITFEKQDFISIANKLVEQGYDRFVWTEASRDNLLIGSEIANADKKPNESTYSGEVTVSNYESMIEAFLKVVQDGTGKSFRDNSRNKALSNGSDLLNSLIDPNKNDSVGVMYNGDGIDAFYASDNFDSVTDGAIRYIRPKNNITLLEGLVIPEYIPKKTEEDIYDIAYNSIYKGVDYSFDEYLSEITTFVKTPFYTIQNVIDEETKETSEQIVWEKDENGELVWEKEGKNNYVATVDYSLLPSARNFDYVNYTPSWKTDFEVIKQFYFNDSVLAATIPGQDEETTFLKLSQDENAKLSKLFSIQLPANATEEELENLFEEEKTKANLNINTFEHSVEELQSKLALNLYITQQPKQQKNGQMPEEDTPDSDLYDLVYDSIKPIDNQLRTQVISKYIVRTKN